MSKPSPSWMHAIAGGHPESLLTCLLVFGNTFSIGAFTVLLPEIGRSNGLSDVALGAIAGAFGLARLLADLPAGLFITHHLRRAVWLGPLALALGIGLLSAGGPPWMMVTGRLLLGLGHSLGMLAGINLIIRHGPAHRQGFVLNAFEMSGMLGVLGGIVLAGALPHDWPWHQSLLVASSPQFVVLGLLPALLQSLPADSGRGQAALNTGTASSISPPATESPESHHARRAATESASETTEMSRTATGAVDAQARSSRTDWRPFAAGAAISFCWAAVGTFVLPLRADRDFDLERQGIAWLTAIPQFVDVLVLLPFGMLADRVLKTRLLGIALMVMAGSVLAIAAGGLPIAVAGAILLGVALASWMLPISLVNRGVSAEKVAWRTGVYRLCVDSGVFLGPLAAGLIVSLVGPWLVGLLCALLLAIVGASLLRRGHR